MRKKLGKNIKYFHLDEIAIEELASVELNFSNFYEFMFSSKQLWIHFNFLD